MSDERYHHESLRPPPESGDGDRKVDSWDWGEALIDGTAYMIKERNHTSARCAFFVDKKKKDLQVTFCLVPPPHISYFCIGYTSGEPPEFVREPNIVATEGNLALIKLTTGSTFTEPRKRNYFVYRAPIHGDESPMLIRLPDPNPELFLPIHGRDLHEREVGILRYSTRRGSEREPFTLPTPSLVTSFTPPTPSLNLTSTTAIAGRHKSNCDDCDAYKIVWFYRRFETTGAEYDLYTYDSKVCTWTRKAAAFLQRPPKDSRTHLIDRVITIGGGMGWVDLRHGIILCDDVHVPGEKENPNPRLLRYIPLPEPRQPDNHLPLCGISSFFRNIVVVQDRIKFIDLQIHASPGSRIPNGWTAVTWSMALSDSGFSLDSELHSRDLDNHLEPSLFVGHPTLSSHDDGVLHLMTQIKLRSRESRVIAVNMKTKKLKGVAKFTTHRLASIDYAYMHTTISNYLNPDPKRVVKRRGSVMCGSSSRKKPHPALTFMSGYDGDQVEEDDIKNLPWMGDAGDSMNLD